MRLKKVAPRMHSDPGGLWVFLRGYRIGGKNQVHVGSYLVAVFKFQADREPLVAAIFERESARPRCSTLTRGWPHPRS